MARTRLRWLILAGAWAFPLAAVGDPLPAGALARFRHGDTVRALAFSPDGTALASAGGETIRLWRSRSGQELRSPLAHDGPAALVFAPDGRSLVAAGPNPQFWDWPAGSVHKPPHPLASEDVVLVSLSADGRLAAADTGHGPPQAWEVTTGKLLSPPRGAMAAAVGRSSALALAPDGTRLARALEVRARRRAIARVQLWDVRAGKAEREWWVSGAVTALAFSPDGRLLAAGGRREVFLYDGRSGRPLAHWTGHDDQVTALAFSADGKSLAAGDESGAFRIWEVVTGGERRAPVRHGSSVTALAFAPAGNLLASGGDNDVGLVWDMAALAGPATDATPEKWWATLASHDAAAAFETIWAMKRAPARAVADLRAHLRPVATPDAATLAQWLAGLNAPRAADRDRASAELARLGERAEGALRRILTGPASAEAQRRAERLLAQLESARMACPPDRLRALRVVEALELMGTADARKFLGELAHGADGAELTRDAQAALARLARLSGR